MWIGGGRKIRTRAGGGHRNTKTVQEGKVAGPAGITLSTTVDAAAATTPRPNHQQQQQQHSKATTAKTMTHLRRRGDRPDRRPRPPPCGGASWEPTLSSAQHTGLAPGNTRTKQTKQTGQEAKEERDEKKNGGILRGAGGGANR